MTEPITRKPDSHLLDEIRTRIDRWLDRFANALEGRDKILVLVLFVFYLWIIKGERVKPLWHDELYTFYIAQASSFAKMLAWTRTVDLNPPLYYILARLTFHVFHPSRLSVRLPSMVAYFVATLCLYDFVRRRLSSLYGLLAGLVLLSSPFSPYAYEARPYALVLAFTGILALGWQRAIEEDKPISWLAFLFVLVGGFGMLLSHVLASVAYAALLLTELIRYFLYRKPNWILWVCLAVPLSACVTYLQPIQHHSGGAFPQQFQASVIQLLSAYSEIWTVIASFMAAALVLIVLLSRDSGKSSRRASYSGFSWPEKILAFGFLCVPLVVILVFMRSHSAYFSRYGMPAIFGTSILVPWFVARWTGASSRAALICAIVFTFGIVTPSSIARHLQNVVHKENVPPTLSGKSSTPLAQVMPDLPFVDASGLTFLEMNHRENGNFLARVYYLTDAQAAVKYSNATIFEGLTYLKTQFPIKDNVVPYRSFIQEHQKFLVFGTYNYPEDWLLRKLLADHATLRFLGDFSSQYKDEQLYEVTLAQPK